MKTFLIATLTLLLAGVTGAAAPADAAALDARIRTTLSDIRSVAANLAALRAALAGASTTDPGAGRAAGESTAPTPGTAPAPSSAPLVVQIAVAEAQLAELELRLGTLLQARASEPDDSEGEPGLAGRVWTDGSLFGTLRAYQALTKREAAADQDLQQDAELPSAKVEAPSKPKPILRRTR